MINKIKQYDWKKYNYSLLIVVIILCSLSAFTVKLAGGEEHGMAFMKNQLFGMILGLVIVAVLSVLDYHFICKFAIIYYIAGIVLTAATHSPIGTDNETDADRWIDIFGITFQPSELMKIILILSLAVFFVKMQSRLDRFSTLVIAGVITGIPVLLIMSQPDLSSSLVAVFILLVMIVVSGLSYKILAPIFALGIPLGVVLFWYIQQPYNVILKNYQYKRVMAWLHPETDVKGDINFQQNHSIRAIASGKLTGKFIQDGGVKAGQSRAYDSVGVNESDFIWSVIGEEFGFLGCCLILLLFAFVIYKCFMVAKKSQDYLGKMIAVGIAAMYMFQIFANISVVTLIFPNTGLPLPFLSNGLSSMVSSMIGIGLIMNIGIQPAKSSKGGFSMRNMYGNDPVSSIDMDLEL
ncbi:MAG: FtsW/RodA/SpoVE family cell cycle protein [Butyribacter sp.]|nr:FtsW/RodA/SpoVE family cell cycle protein [bacterium]MDY3853508.1 FtsW/RodA/SpoVE family cell cycle protein [Butyribacter sp.]